MPTQRTYLPISDGSAWRGPSFQHSSEWLYELNEDNVCDLDRALMLVRKRGIPLEQITRDDFPLPSMEPTLDKIAHEIEYGQGFALIRGLPIARWGTALATSAFWGLSTHLGTPTTQNLGGDRMVAVRDTGASSRDLNVRGPLTKDQLYFHSDFSDIVGLLCIQPAKEGGISRICSSIEIFNELAQRRRTDLIDVLYEGFLFDRKGEQREGVPPVSEKLIPMLSWYENRLSFRFVPGWAKAALLRSGKTWTPKQKEAFDEVNRITNRPGMYLDMKFKPGDVQFLNNYTVLHSRTSFVDHDEPERKRLLQRIWLRSNCGRELAEDFDRLFGDDQSTRNGIPANNVALANR